MQTHIIFQADKYMLTRLFFSEKSRVRTTKQAAGYYTYTLRFAGLFKLPIPLRFAFGIGVLTIK
jgi:hypothetical protein